MGAIVLTVVPTYRTARIDIDVTAQVRTISVSLPSAALDTDITALVLTITPSFPQAAIAMAIIARVLTVTPEYPVARLSSPALPPTLAPGFTFIGPGEAKTQGREPQLVGSQPRLNRIHRKARRIL